MSNDCVGVLTGQHRGVPSVRFGARAALALLALALVAVPFGLLLLLVRDRWAPLLDVDHDFSAGLHSFALAHDWFVTAMKTVSRIGTAVVYLPLFAVIAAWLLSRRLPRLALFDAVTVIGSPLLNSL